MIEEAEMTSSDKKETITRTGISLESDLLKEFDVWLKQRSFPNRSEGIRFLIREKLDQEILVAKKDLQVVGSLTYIFDHHGFDSSLKLTEIQHDFGHLIISTMHAHITHDICLETIFLRGRQDEVRKLADAILALKGVQKGQIYLIPSHQQ